jgi:hypothetical protein
LLAFNGPIQILLQHGQIFQLYWVIICEVRPLKRNPTSQNQWQKCQIEIKSDMVPTSGTNGGSMVPMAMHPNGAIVVSYRQLRQWWSP